MSILKDKLMECREDYVGLWSIAWRVKRCGGIHPDRIFQETMGVVKGLLEQEDIVAGQFQNNLFEVWSFPHDQILARIEAEWRALGREPNLGDIVWFTSLSFLKGTMGARSKESGVIDK